MVSLRSKFKSTSLGSRVRKIRITLQNRKDSAGFYHRNPILNGYNRAKVDPAKRIEETYLEYTSSVSSPVAAISLELALLMWFVLKKTRPETLVDLGSGFSSYLFRLYQAECLAAGDDCRVYSCDDNPYWLERTAEFLEKKHLSTSGMCLWDEYLLKHADIRPSLLLHDLGYPPVRVQELPRVFEICGPSTLLFIDDMHKPQIRQTAISYACRRDYCCYDLTSQTYDRFGRYAWMVFACIGTRGTIRRVERRAGKQCA